MFRIFLSSALIVLGACTNVVPETAASLSRFDPLTADPKDFAVSIDLPPGVIIQPDSAVLTLSATAPGETEVRGRVGLASTVEGSATIYGIRDADAVMLRTVQSEIRALKAIHGRRAKGSLAVEMIACAVGDGPRPDATVDIDLRVASSEPFMPLVRDLPVETVLSRLPDDAFCPSL